MYNNCMSDLSVTFNLVIFAAACALAVLLLFFAIDIFAVKKPNKGLRAAAIVIGALSLVASLALVASGVGMRVGLVTLSGSSAVVFSLELKGLAPLFALCEYIVSLAMFGAIAALSLVCIIAASVKRGLPKKQAAESVVDETNEADALSEQPEAQQALDPEAKPETDYALSDMHSIMDEITGLVDSLDTDEEKDEKAPHEPPKEEQLAKEEQPEEKKAVISEIPDDISLDDISFDYEPVEESPQDYFSDMPEDDYDGDETYGGDDEEPDAESDEQSDEESDGDDAEAAAETAAPVRPKETVKEDKSAEKQAALEPTVTKIVRPEPAEAKTVRPERVGQVVRRLSDTREIDDYTTLSQPVKGGKASGAPETRTIVRKNADADKKAAREPAKEVEPQTGGLPMTKRHVIINRRNVVNMFSEYLKTKSDDEKERIKSSINTIIIK